MFQYGRYLLLSSSRPGTLPANLQGLWNVYLNPPWACDYHNNINVQMAYWGAEPANLSECHEALINYVEAMAPGCRTSPRPTRVSIPRTASRARLDGAYLPEHLLAATAGSGTFPARRGMRCMSGNLTRSPVTGNIWKSRPIPDEGESAISGKTI